MPAPPVHSRGSPSGVRPSTRSRPRAYSGRPLSGKPKRSWKGSITASSHPPPRQCSGTRAPTAHPAAEAAPHAWRRGCGARRRRRRGGSRGARRARPGGRSRCPSRRRRGARCGRRASSAAPMGGRVSRDCASRNSSRDFDRAAHRRARGPAAGASRRGQAERGGDRARRREDVRVNAPRPRRSPAASGRRRRPWPTSRSRATAPALSIARYVKRRRASTRTEMKWYQSPPAAT